MFLSEFSIKRPVTVFMLMAALLIFGAIGFLRLGVDQFPKVEFPVVTVTTMLQGASPEVIEENITDRIEEEVATIEGVRSLTSVSSHGASIVTVEFEMERDIDIAAQDVRDRVASIAKFLPEDIDTPIVSKLYMQAQPIMWVAVSGDRPIQDVTKFAEDSLKPRLETLKGVGAITIGGKRKRTVRVWLDRARLMARNVSVDDVSLALKRENAEIPGGFLESVDREFSVKIEGEFERAGDFKDLIIAYRGGFPIRISDVGSVEDGIEDKRALARYNGKEAVGLGIRKKAGSNTVELAKIVRAKVEEAKADLPSGINLDIAFDSSIFIEESIEEMEFALIFGGVLAALIVFFFLRNTVATLIVATAIPLSIIGSFVFTYFLGFTLNTMTMLAFTLAIGVVIDDAIIIIENIHRHAEEGESRLDAALKGSKEIAFAAIAATASLAAVFVPVAFMKGVIGRFFFEFGITVAIAIAISLLVALTLTPMLSSKFLDITGKESRFYRLSEAFYKVIESFYGRLLAVSLSKRLMVVLIALGIFSSSIFFWMTLGKEFVPQEDQSRFMVMFETPVGSSIEYTSRKLKRNEELLASIPEIKSFFGAIALGEGGRVNKGLMFVRMHPRKERKRSQQEIIGFLRRELNKEPGMTVFVNSMTMNFGSSRGPALEFIIKGPTLAELDKYAGLITGRFKKIPGVVDVDTDMDLGLPELKVTIDRERAADAGVDLTTIAKTINSLVGGSDVTEYKEAGKRYDVRIKLIPSQSATPSDLKELYVRSKDGGLVKFENLIGVEETVAPSVVNRRDRERSITITSNLEGDKTLGSALEDIAAISKEALPEGFTTRLGGSAEMFQESMQSMVFALFLAVIITYMILASQFESFIHPFTVMLAFPLSIVGALGALWATGNTINIYSLIALILLVGLVVKNSILLVDYTNTLRRNGMPMREAVLTAGPVRLRPILMTALSTILGVLPTALAIGPGSESRTPMAIATIGGMVVSTFLTLILVPVVYTILDELKEKIGIR